MLKVAIREGPEMAVLVEPSAADPEVTGDRPLVEQLVALALELSVDHSLSVADKAAALGRFAAHDRAVLGRAWLSLVVPALRGGSPSAVVSERLVATALELEGQDEPAGDVGLAPLHICP